MKEDGFEARERLGAQYYADPRWKEVSKLRAELKQMQANSLVDKIRQDWGLD